MEGREGQERRREGVIDPLQMPEVLEIICKWSTLEDLKTYRQVNRTWMLESSKAMKGSAQVRITGQHALTEDMGGLEAFMAVVGNELGTFRDAPFVETFILDGLSCNLPSFWELCGSHMKSLTLERVFFENGEQFRQAIFVGCPNLEKLQFYAWAEDRIRPPRPAQKAEEPSYFEEPRYPQNRNLKTLAISHQVSDLGVSGMKILNHFPSIEALTLGRGLDQGTGSRFDDLLRSLAIVRGHDSQNCNLKTFKININELREPLLLATVLVDGTLQLENLAVYRINMPRDVVPLQRVLEGHACSLKILHLFGHNFGPGGEEGDIFPLPNNASLNSLKELAIGWLRFTSMSFLRCVPNLCGLGLFYGSTENASMIRNTNWEEMENFALPSCEELGLDTVSAYPEPVPLIDIEDLRRLNKWLPHIHRLLIGHLTNETFAFVCDRWPKLISLSLTVGEIDDSGFTGLDEEDVEAINEGGANGTWNRTTVRRANITSLNELQKLSIGMGDRQLGYCSAVYGVQLIFQLQQLKVDSRRDVNDETWTRLLAQFPWRNNDLT